MNLEKTINWIAIIAIPLALFILTPTWSEMHSPKKALEYSIIAKSTIGGLDFEKKDWPGIKIEYGGQKIQNGTFLSLIIANTGKVPIKADDFESPILIIVNKPDSILAHRIVKFPDNLLVALSIEKHGANIKPLLLNPGDFFLIELFGKDDFDISSVSARILGIESINKTKDDATSGIYLKNVQYLGPGRTREKELFRIPTVILEIGTIVLLIISVTFFSLLRLKVSYITKIIIGIISLVTYGLGIKVVAVIAVSLKDSQQEWWFIIFTFILLALVSILVGILIIRDIVSLREPCPFRQETSDSQT